MLHCSAALSRLGVIVQLCTGASRIIDCCLGHLTQSLRYVMLAHQITHANEHIRPCSSCMHLMVEMAIACIEHLRTTQRSARSNSQHHTGTDTTALVQDGLFAERVQYVDTQQHTQPMIPTLLHSMP